MVLHGNKHIPFANVSETAAFNSVTFMAPSKVFNMPGVISSFYIIPNQTLKNKYASYLEALEVNAGNIFAYQATVACYEKGEDWRIAMLDYVQDNIDFVAEYLKEHLPQIKPMIPEASFLIWLDCKELGLDSEELYQFFIREAGLGLNKGTIFGPGGENHLRMNLACSRKVLEKAMSQLYIAVKNKWM
jgi:cystathionine beta-lyase